MLVKNGLIIIISAILFEISLSCCFTTQDLIGGLCLIRATIRSNKPNSPITNQLIVLRVFILSMQANLNSMKPASIVTYSMGNFGGIIAGTQLRTMSQILQLITLPRGQRN